MGRLADAVQDANVLPALVTGLGANPAEILDRHPSLSCLCWFALLGRVIHSPVFGIFQHHQMHVCYEINLATGRHR